MRYTCLLCGHIQIWFREHHLVEHHKISKVKAVESILRNFFHEEKKD